ncbi:GroES-like protein [Coniophora puteana RWD-64-598 SS2]|uniref:GroES-like protein n=1 Tax=Coniophora puteana (strain RWD-64-598) TaxID=741705 RepID=A0A5M3MDS8_CONPW|nr:GroES-like protein [Coniophora puteana RWD-64-598 SS2]EIW77197.1 GroES-like protein [Coniophora puteana RWD-64-598 SS2]
MSQKALFIPSKQAQFQVGPADIPKPGDGEILVKVHAIGINPLEWKQQAFGVIIEHYPAIVGQDVAGIVEEVGAGVTNFVKGERVAARAGFNSNAHGAYQEYMLAPADLTAKIPSNISLEAASSLPTGVDTATIGLFGPLDGNLTSPTEKLNAYQGQSILILGGSGSVGVYTIQLARLSGFSTIIATASLRHETYLKSLGATHVINRTLPEAEVIQAVTSISNDIKIVYDTISEPDTQKIGWAVLASGGHLVTTVGATVKPEAGDTRTVKWVFAAPTIPPNRPVCTAVWDQVTKWLEDGSLVPNKVEVVPGGLGGIVTGLDRLRANQVSGVKLVVTL